MSNLSGHLARLCVALLLVADPQRRRDERGDVPGWVLITVMTAGLVTVIWGVADGQLTQLLKDALSNVGAGN